MDIDAMKDGAPPAFADPSVPSVVPDWRAPFGIGRRIPGRMDAWAAIIIAMSCALTPLIVSTSLTPAWTRLAGESMSLTGKLLGYAPHAAIALLALALLPRGPAPRWVRAAVVIPFLHIIIAALTAWLWHTYVPHYMDYARARLPMTENLPAPRIALIAGALMLAAALVPARRHRRGRVPRGFHIAVVASLTFLLCLGLWLPITAHMAGMGALSEQSLFAWVTLLPPAAIAVIAAATTWLAPAALAHIPRALAITLPLGVIIGVLFRMNAEYGNYLAYANMIHVVLSAAVFSLCCITALAIAHVRALVASRDDTGRRPPWVQLGTLPRAGERRPLPARVHGHSRQ